MSNRIPRPPWIPDPLAPKIKEKIDARTTVDETQYILDATLLPHHRQDPNVLSFIRSYMGCRSSTQAAKESGLMPRHGQTLLRRPDIHAAIVALTDKSVMKFGFDAHEIIERVKEVANVSLADLENPDGTYKRLSEMDPATARAIKKLTIKETWMKDPNGMTVKSGEIIEIELWDKMKATELLGREKKLFKENKVIEHDVTNNMKDILLNSARLAEEKYIEWRDNAERDATPALPPPIDIESTDE